MTQYVYRFGGGISDGGQGDKNLLGGKGANLAEMASIGLPVPPGFTISTEMCTRYYEEGETFPESLYEEVANGVAHIEKVTGKRFGDAADPLLVSVRSGARVSMPGAILPAVFLSGAAGAWNIRCSPPPPVMAVRLSIRPFMTWSSAQDSSPP